MPPPGRSATTSMAKRGQILGYASLTGPRSMKLQEIAELTGIPLSTCAGIISNAKTRSKETGILDLCADVNLAPRPTCSKGMNKALTPAQEQALIELATKDRQHERMSYKALAKEAGLDISPSTVSRILETTVREGCRRTGTFKIRKKKRVVERPRAGDTGETEGSQPQEPATVPTPVDNVSLRASGDFPPANRASPRPTDLKD